MAGSGLNRGEHWHQATANQARQPHRNRMGPPTPTVRPTRGPMRTKRFQVEPQGGPKDGCNQPGGASFLSGWGLRSGGELK